MVTNGDQRTQLVVDLPAPAGGQTLAERKLDVDRLEAVLQGMIIMLRDNPDISIPWSVDISCDATEAEYENLVRRHDLHTLESCPSMAYLAPLAEKYTAAEDRADFYMPWSIKIENPEAAL